MKTTEIRKFGSYGVCGPKTYGKQAFTPEVAGRTYDEINFAARMEADGFHEVNGVWTPDHEVVCKNKPTGRVFHAGIRGRLAEDIRHERELDQERARLEQGIR